MPNGFQPNTTMFTSIWRNQNFNSLDQVTNEIYVNFSIVKWLKTIRASAPNIPPYVYFWFNPKEQDTAPDITLKGPPAAQMIADLDEIWSGASSPPTLSGFQPGTN